MKRVVSFVAWVAALAVLVLTAAPAAISQEEAPLPPPLDPAPEAGFDDGFEGGGPGFPDTTYEGYPEEYDPAAPGIEYNAELELTYDPETGMAYDPYGGIEFDLSSGAATEYETGEPLPPLPADMVQFLVDGFDSDDGFEQAPVEPVDPGAAGSEVPRSDLETLDPVLSLYSTGFTEADLADYSLDIDALPEGANDDAFQFVSYEIALLFEAGAFTRDTPWFETFSDIHAEFELDDAPTESLVQTFAAVDTELARRGPIYRPALDPQADWSVDWAISELNGPFYDQLAEGDLGFLNGFEYAAALLRVMAGGPDIALAADGSAENVQLEVALAAAVEALSIEQDLNELLRTEVDALREQVAALSDPAITAALAVLGAEPATETNDPASDPLLIGAIAGGAVLLMLVAAFLLRRARGRAGTHTPDDTLSRDEAMATNQLLAGAKDEDDVIRILDRAGQRQVGAPLVLFHAEPDGLRRAGESTIITGSDLQRVVGTGQQVKTTLHDDPAFPGAERAVLALPVISGGKVQAVLAAHRTVNEPFADADRATLEPIAPALGGALDRAAELGTMSKLAMVDGLTSLGNRRRLDGDLETTLASSVAADAPLGFAMVDVDHFKTYNDTHGHAAGDEVLRRVAATIARSVRETDVVYRYGGEEFSMLLPGATPDEVAQVAERVRATVEAEAFEGEELQPGGRLTVSIGVATLESGGGDDIRIRADQALYRAKENGRNQVAFA